MKLLSSFFIFISILTPLYASEGYTCFHTQVCNLMAEVTSLKQKEAITIPDSIDPHHFEIKGKTLKKLMSSSLLILPDIHIAPWSRKLKSTKKTKIVRIKSANHHFWLSSKSICEAKKNTKTELLELGIDVSHSPCPTKEEQRLIKKINEKTKGTFIATHDALVPLMVELDLEGMALKGSHHGESYSPKTLKNLKRLLKNKESVTWIFEEQIHETEKLKKYVRKGDKIISLNTVGKLNSKTNEVLLQLLRKMAGE